MTRPTIRATQTNPIPDWAFRQRHLIDAMNEAAPVLQDRYTRKDGSYIWRDTFGGMDGSDDAYESYYNWPLFYALGGSADIHERSRFLWDAVTRQFTAYGQIYREFDAYYDWMHHGESSIFFYFFGLADPGRHIDKVRAIRFADLYSGENSINYDHNHRRMLSPINGSKGPRFVNTFDDWSTIRWVLADYPVPFDDLDAPVEMKGWRHPDEIVPIADWNDDSVFEKVLQALNERQMRCDVPLNLASTSLVTNAYLYTGDDRYKTWVLDYLEAWADRIKENGGCCPDNIGPANKIGETIDGKWLGGYYGWQWPHGLLTIMEPLTIAAMNAVLLTGDMSYLDIPRGQIDYMINLGREEQGQLVVPHRHTDDGWTAYRPLSASLLNPIWYISQSEADQKRIEQLPQVQTEWLEISGDESDHFGAWYSYLAGRLPEYPRVILESQSARVLHRMDAIRSDDGDPQEWDIHHWQDLNPVCTEALVQLTCGGPEIVYRGGLLHVRLRYFDIEANRPGLPEDVSALVSDLDDKTTSLELVNLNPIQQRRLVVQAGAFGEHRFTDAREGSKIVSVDDQRLDIVLPPGRSIKIELGQNRYSNSPSYEQPV